ncbi:MAG: CNNM domain-containing protein [Fuerstiella sp.]
MTFAVLFSVLLFLVGLKLSAFFSGSETGFYRVSTLQLTLQKQRGDTVAGRLFYFVAHPERFVATTLVGNNVSNYLTTLAIGLMVQAVWQDGAGGKEIIATLLLTPVIFIVGELIPKSLYYRAPMSLLRAGSLRFNVFYYLFLPISYPLIRISRFVSHFGQSDRRPLEVVFGRTRLYGVLEAGQREGLLTELQRNLAENLMQVANQPVGLSMVPAAAIHGISETASIDDAVAVASATDTSYVLMRPDGHPHHWSWCVRIADMLTSELAPRLVKQSLPEFDAVTPRLEVLAALFREYSPFAAVTDNGQIVGIIQRQTLVSELFRVIRPASPELEALLFAGTRSEAVDH